MDSAAAPAMTAITVMTAALFIEIGHFVIMTHKSFGEKDDLVQLYKG
jgi:hypothetical protein